MLKGQQKKKNMQIHCLKKPEKTHYKEHEGEHGKLFLKKEKGRQVDLKWVRTQLGITDIITVEETNLGTRYRKEQKRHILLCLQHNKMGREPQLNRETRLT